MPQPVSLGGRGLPPSHRQRGDPRGVGLSGRALFRVPQKNNEMQGSWPKKVYPQVVRPPRLPDRPVTEHPFPPPLPCERVGLSGWVRNERKKTPAFIVVGGGAAGRPPALPPLFLSLTAGSVHMAAAVSFSPILPVLHTCWMMVRLNNLSSVLTKLDLLALLTSAIGHDSVRASFLYSWGLPGEVARPGP